MIGFMGLEEQVDVDFGRARRRGLVGRLVNRVRGEPRVLLAFDEARKASAGGAPASHNRVRLGRGVVEVSKIAGSVGRWREFDRRFMPAGTSAERWKRVDQAFLRGEELPPVSLYKLGERYFVEDGNHRVSVARYHGVEMIEAEITQIRPRLPEHAGPRRAPERKTACAAG